MDREKDGRFGKGNKIGVGRPPRATETAYLNVLMEECDIETWRGIVKAANDDAKEGDARARDWLGKYLMGAPKGSSPSLLSVQLALLSDADPVLMAHARNVINTEMAEIFNPDSEKVNALVKELAELENT